jgi:hypothetical protein
MVMRMHISTRRDNGLGKCRQEHRCEIAMDQPGLRSAPYYAVYPLASFCSIALIICGGVGGRHWYNRVDATGLRRVAFIWADRRS